MQITVDINDESLKAAMEKGISGLSNEQLTEMAKEAMQAYMMDPRNLENIVFDKRNYITGTDKIRPEIMKMLLDSFTKEEVEEYRQKIFKLIDIYGDRLMVRTLAEIFGNMLMTEDAKNKLTMTMWRMAKDGRQ